MKGKSYRPVVVYPAGTGVSDITRVAHLLTISAQLDYHVASRSSGGAGCYAASSYWRFAVIGHRVIRDWVDIQFPTYGELIQCAGSGVLMVVLTLPSFSA
jgi:hypothetical protein